MIFATRLSDTALIIAALGIFVTSATAAWISVKTHKEVKTMNGLSMAQMADAAETRRVDAIKPTDRTVAEQQHIDAEPRTEERP